MDIKELIKNSPFYPVLILESIFSEYYRRLFIKISGSLLIILIAVAGFFSFSNLIYWAPKVWGVFFLGLAFYLAARMLEFYFNASYYFDNVALNRYQPGDFFTFTVGRVLLNVKDGDILRGFLLSPVGRQIIRRCGISDQATRDYLAKRPRGTYYKLPLSPDQVLKLRDLVKWLVTNDQDFSRWLAGFGINEAELIGAVGWVVYEIEYREYRKRWWSESNLSKLPGLAKDWGFGTTYYLDKYSWDLLYGLDYSSELHEYSTRSEEVFQVENILSKQKEANVFIVADTTSERMDIVWHLVRRIKYGETNAALEHKRPVLFNTAVFMAHFKDKASVESELLKILKESQAAGNIILVFDNFAGLFQGFAGLGSDFISLVYPFLVSNAIQIIGLAGTEDFHHLLESNASLMATFDRIFLRPLPDESIIRSLEQTVWAIEKEHKLFFTYPALLAIVKSANNYFVVSDSGDKAVDLLTEIIPWAEGRSYHVIGEDEVAELVRGKIGVPIGKIQPAERESLLNLEQNLHQRVIGQEEAVNQVSNALRRARAGIRNEARPIGSFLFLGPTGVGKTETSKALAEVMFGNEDKMIRLDMSEYQTTEAVAKLIGSSATGQSGILADLVREHPYGVLLLDEFEKTPPAVHDLFLQIFDEGYFSDKSGKKVNLRNLIIIATSNAAADLIWQMVRSGQAPQEKVDELIDYIVQRAILKPELLNRFDAVVVFHPLRADELNKIASLMLSKLAKRLNSQGIDLLIKDKLAETVARLGSNEVFGARPMQRFIQDKIEQPIANAIISGIVASGNTVDFDIDNTGQLTLVKK